MKSRGRLLPYVPLSGVPEWQHKKQNCVMAVLSSRQKSILHGYHVKCQLKPQMNGHHLRLKEDIPDYLEFGSIIHCSTKELMKIAIDLFSIA